MMRKGSPSRRAHAMTRGAVALGLIGLLSGPAGLGAQTGTGTITGHVTDSATGRPVVAVRLSVVGMDRAAVTAEDGGFVLAAVPEGMQRVRASRIGFAAGEQTVAVTAGQIATLNFAIQPIAVTLSDVVVVGYGTQRRADLTGAVASVSAAELRPTAVASLEQGLEGRVAGVYVNPAYIHAYGATTQYPYGGRPGSVTPDSIRKVIGAGTNWQDAIFRSALVRDVALGFSGGDARGSYAIAGNLLDQGGVIRGSEFKRGGLRVNLDRSVSRNFQLSSNLAVTRSFNDMVRSSTINGYRSIGIVRQAVTYVPMQFLDSSKLSNDPRAEDPTVWSQYGANPLRYTDQVHEGDQLTRGLGGLRGVASLGGGLSLDFSVGANYERRTYSVYFPRSVNEGFSPGGDAGQAGSEFGSLLSENLVRYVRDFGSGHRIDAVGGFTYQTDKSTWNAQEVQGFPDDLLGGQVLQNGTNPQKPQSGSGKSVLASWLGRVNYALRDRYLFTATLRADGSSKFAANNKWAAFPAVAFAWRAIDEPALKRQTLLSDLKLRVSYGKSGNQAIGAYQSLPAISGATLTLNEVVVPAYVVTQLGNPNLG